MEAQQILAFPDLSRDVVNLMGIYHIIEGITPTLFVDPEINLSLKIRVIANWGLRDF